MEERDQELHEEDHPKEGGANMHSCIFPPTTSQYTPHAARHMHDPMSSVSHEHILPSGSLAVHLARSAFTSGAEDATLSRADASSAVTGLRLIETDAARSVIHPARLPKFDDALSNIMPAGPKLPTEMIMEERASSGYGTHPSPAHYLDSQDHVSSYDADLTVPDSPIGVVAVYHPSDDASQAPSRSSRPSKRERFAASGSDNSIMSITSSMMSMDLSCLQSEDFVALSDAIINSDSVNHDVCDSQMSDFIENILLLRDDEARKAFKSSGTDPSYGPSQDIGIDNKQSSTGATDDQADTNPPATTEQSSDIARTSEVLMSSTTTEKKIKNEQQSTIETDYQADTYVMSNPPATTKQSSDIAETHEILISSTTTEKKKKPRRELDDTRTVEPTDDDILLGRGGHTNIHPGNVRFREKALELSPWYESCSKDDKYHVSNVLIISMKREGRRFLEKGVDGFWHEVVENYGVRKKASQLLREPYINGKDRHTL